MDECISSFLHDNSRLPPGGYLPPPAPPPPYSTEQLLMEDMLTQAALFSIDQNQLYNLTPPHENFIPQSPMVMAPEDDSYLLMDDAGVAENVGQLLFPGDVYKYEMDSYESLVQHGYGNDDLQVFGNNNNIHMVGECSSRQMNPHEFTMKIGRLSAEERKEKIDRYMKKRTERNFTKKIKYACRKTLADSRHRVRGRFAKNEEFSEADAHNYDGEEEEDVMVREVELMFNSSGILASDSGVNSFQYNYTLQSWM